MCLQQWECHGGMSVGECPQQLGNVCNSGELEYDLRNLRVRIVIHNSAYMPPITSDDTCYNMYKAH